MYAKGRCCNTLLGTVWFSLEAPLAGAQFTMDLLKWGKKQEKDEHGEVKKGQIRRSDLKENDEEEKKDDNNETKEAPKEGTERGKGHGSITFSVASCHDLVSL